MVQCISQLQGHQNDRGQAKRSQAAMFLVDDTLAKAKGQGLKTGQVGKGLKEVSGQDIVLD